jgi:CelD/BcsL family acetyltransferase involved in cellulose biosynthesis
LSGNSDLSIEVVRDFTGLEPFRQAWNDLVSRAQTSTIFQTFEWHESWYGVYGGGTEPCVLLASRHGTLIGIAPLMLSHRRVLGRTQRVLEFIGTRMSDYCDFIFAPADVDVLPAFFWWISQFGFDLLYLRDLPENSPTLAAITAYFDARHTDARPLYEAPAWEFGDRAADYRLPQKKSLRRHFNHFARAGHLEFVARAPKATTQKYLEALFAQHIERWGQLGMPSIFHEPRHREFFCQLANALEPTGWLLFSAVIFEGKPIALHFGFEYGRRIVWYKPSFDVAYARHSPGEVLLKYLLEYALERKVSHFDFTIGEDGYKYRFANRTPLNYAVRVLRRRPDLWAMRALLGAKNFVERSTLAARVSRRLLGNWRDHLWM